VDNPLICGAEFWRCPQRAARILPPKPRPSAESFLNPKILGGKTGKKKKCHFSVENRLRWSARSRKPRFTETATTDRGAAESGTLKSQTRKI
jgi:hypothetical protein